jgi:hypothetical protein
MNIYRRKSALFSALFAFLFLTFARAHAAYPYYGGADSNTDQPPAQPTPVYPSAPVYPAAPVYRQPAWSLPNAAALAPWDWNFDFGGGPTTVTGSNNLLNGGSNFEFGGGYNFSPRVGFVLEYMNSWLGVSDAALQQNGAVDGTAYVWGLTLNPIWRFRISGPIGGYLIGGGGYYERETRFDEPVTVFVPTFHGGFYGDALERVRNYDDAGGLNMGAGLTWNLGWGTKLFVEARYHYIFTSGTATQIIPVTFGLRW